MSWYVGVALREHHQGPLHLAAWLERSWSGSDQRVVGVHVMGPGADSPYTVPDTQRGALEGKVEAEVREAMNAAGSASASTDVPVLLLEGDSPEQAFLERFEGDHDLRALIVGRRSNRHDHRFVRLGKTTRRLLRLAPFPVIVTPPDLPAEGPGDGPIILATGLDEETEAATHFARQLAVATGRPLVVVMVVPHFQWGEVYVATLADERARIDEAERERAAAALAKWADARNLGDARQVVLQGDAVHELALFASKENAALVVSGSRKTGMMQRIFDVSVSSELAGAATCPVAVVGNT